MLVADESLATFFIILKYPDCLGDCRENVGGYYCFF